MYLFLVRKRLFCASVADSRDPPVVDAVCMWRTFRYNCIDIFLSILGWGGYGFGKSINLYRLKVRALETTQSEVNFSNFTARPTFVYF